MVAQLLDTDFESAADTLVEHQAASRVAVVQLGIDSRVVDTVAASRESAAWIDTVWAAVGFLVGIVPAAAAAGTG